MDGWVERVILIFETLIPRRVTLQRPNDMRQLEIFPLPPSIKIRVVVRSLCARNCCLIRVVYRLSALLVYSSILTSCVYEVHFDFERGVLCCRLVGATMMGGEGRELGC
jgi:hypothetical protein